MAAFIGPTVSEPSTVAATDVITTLLANPQVGRLVTELPAERGLVKGIGIDFLTQRAPGLFGVWAICDREKIAEVKTAIKQELARMASEPVSPVELATARRLLAAEYAFSNETATERVSTLAFYEALDSYRLAPEYLPSVRSVTPADITRAAQRLLGEPVWAVLAEEAAP
jgi:predicted Zn-dependent peptidase